MLREDDLIFDRFEVGELAGRGGMSTVYRALDRQTQRPVALKLLTMTTSIDEARFIREGQLLAELSHPGIVRYIAHGLTPSRTPFLAMEWLEGEDLSARLARLPLSVEESLTLARRVANALADAHAHGIVHRDVKPSNIFLVDNRPNQIKVVDFGLARLAMPSRAMTKTGAIIGTLGYMAPEQARGEREIDARTDVFALGCVLFECLTGQSPFNGKDVVAVLVKILSGKAPRLLELRPDLSPTLDDLIGQMMARHRGDRPHDAGMVAAELEARLSVVEPRPHRPSRHPVALSQGEQRLVSIILLSATPNGEVPPDDSDVSLDLGAPLTPEQLVPQMTLLRSVAESRGADIAQMADGTILVLFKSSSAAVDQVSHAAACALSMLDAAPGSTIALATGPAELLGQWPEGQVIDRAAMVLQAASDAGSDAVFIDEVTSGLLNVRFKVEGDGPVRLLLGERRVTGARRLLGHRTPCVGRTKELAFLESLLTECISESTAGAVLVTGSAGVGKSRLQNELVKRLRQSEVAEILLARGKSLSGGSPLSLAAQLVHQSTAIPHGLTIDVTYGHLYDALEKLIPADDHLRVTEFLGELIGAPTTKAPSPQLRAARNEARLMTEQMRRAFEEWLGVLLSRGPVLLVLEDLHWGDQPSVTLLDGALRTHADTPLMMLALARPEINQVFPRLWNDADVQGLRLGALKRRAAGRLVRAVLGDEPTKETMARIVRQAGGNAFYLEELIRHVATGEDAQFPETVLAIAQSRLDGLEAEVRRVLRAGSIFGEVLWENAVLLLLGKEMPAREISEWLDVLIEREILEPSLDERFTDERELVFRHDLLREAAYSMLTDRDRELGHRLAAEWLEKRGERDSMILAEHWEKGGFSDRAVAHFLIAGQRAVAAGNLDAALSISTRGLNAGADGAERGELLLIQSYVHAFRNELVATFATSGEALGLLPEGSAPWFRALAGLAGAGTWGGNSMALMQALQALQGFSGALEPIGPVGYASNMLHEALMHIGQHAQANSWAARLSEAAAAAGYLDPAFHGWVEVTRASRASLGIGLVGECLAAASSARARFRDAGDRVAGLTASALEGYAMLQTGQLEAALERCQATLIEAQTHNLPVPASFAALFLGFAQSLYGEHEAAIATLEPLLVGTNSLLAAYGRAELVLALMGAERIEDALREAELAVTVSSIFPIANAHALSELAAVELRLNRPTDALKHTRAAFDRISRNAVDQVAESYLHLTHVEALDAVGEREEALAALESARDRLWRQAKSLADDSARDAYLSALPPNARTLALADEWL